MYHIFQSTIFRQSKHLTLNKIENTNPEIKFVFKFSYPKTSHPTSHSRVSLIHKNTHSDTNLENYTCKVNNYNIKLFCQWRLFLKYSNIFLNWMPSSTSKPSQRVDFEENIFRTFIFFGVAESLSRQHQVCELRCCCEEVVMWNCCCAFCKFAIRWFQVIIFLQVSKPKLKVWKGCLSDLIWYFTY